jgi:hypothetical protein
MNTFVKSTDEQWGFLVDREILLRPEMQAFLES